MKVKRNLVTIELTERELEEAFREKEHMYHLEDAFRHLCTYIFGGDPIYCEDEIDTDDGYIVAALEDFKRQYGFSYFDGIYKDSENYLLEEIVGVYEQTADCNEAENITWQNAVDIVLTRNKD